MEKITLGDPTENPNIGPGGERRLDEVDSGLHRARQERRAADHRRAARGQGKDGYFIQPTVIADIQPKSKLEQEEIFGPVLAVIKARDYDHALEIANDTEFGLTGAVYSRRSRRNWNGRRREFHVGNLYLNRKCTGAMVGAHPFGGFNMSGTDSKAGGPDYLLLFTQAKSVGKKIS